MKVLFFGPYTGPVTGQSMAFKEIFNNFTGIKILCNSTRFGKNKFLNSFYCFYKLFFVFLFCSFDKVYFTSSRSSSGFLKDLLLIFFCQLYSKKLINHLHGNDFNLFYENSGKLRKLVKWGYNRVNTSIVLLPKMESEFKHFPKMKICVVANSYNHDLENISLEIQNKKNQILYLSNIMESKGILLFLDAVSEILDKNPTLSIKIAGEPMGDYISSTKEIQKKFEGKLAQLSLYKSRLIYLGSVHGMEKNKLLQESSIFILPTFYRTEAYPISIIEAMRTGNAIITTNHNFLPDIVNNNNGLLIKTHSSKAITEAIETLLSNPERIKNIQTHNSLEASKKYSPKRYVSQVESVIHAA